MRLAMGFAAALALAGLAAGSLWAADTSGKKDLKVGDKAPRFQALDDQGNTWKSSDHVGKKIVVVYFFPAALTGG